MSASSVMPASRELVAPMGDSQAQLLAAATEATAAGKQPLYVTIKAPTRSYDFPAYAQVAQSSTLMIVRGYGRIYTFPKANVAVYWGRELVGVDQLPSVTVPGLEKLTAGKTPGNFTSGSVGHKKFLCPDCTAVLGYPPNVRAIEAAFNGKVDPWQVSPSYVPFTASAPPSGVVTLSAPRHPHMYYTSCWGGNPGYGFTGGGTGGGLDGGSANCYPSVLSYSVMYVSYPPPNCNAAIAAKIRSPQARPRSQQAMNAARAAVLSRSVADDEIEGNIDRTITGRVRDLVRSAMQELPPYARQRVAGVAEDGTFFANRQIDYDEHLREGSWEQLSGSIWRKPNGEIVNVPDMWKAERAAFQSRTTSGTRATLANGCPPAGDPKSGAYVRTGLCNTTSRSYSASVDATSVGGLPGPSWCLTNNFGYGDTGYLLIGAFGNAGGANDAGLQWSPTNHNYAMYARDSSGKADPIPSSYSFPPSALYMQMSIDNTTWWLVVGNASYSLTWMYHKSTALPASTAFTYKQGTMLAQDAYFPTDGSYFGVDAVYGTPLFTWSSATYFDQVPDSTRALLSGNNEGINLHP